MISTFDFKTIILIMISTFALLTALFPAADLFLRFSQFEFDIKAVSEDDLNKVEMHKPALVL